MLCLDAQWACTSLSFEAPIALYDNLPEQRLQKTSLHGKAAQFALLVMPVSPAG